MKCACCRGFLSSGIAILGLVGLGFGGYNVITTGCPLGSCHKDAGSMTTVSTTSAESSGCPFTSKESCPKPACCAKGEMAAKADPAAQCPVHTAQSGQKPADVPAKDPA